MQENPTQLIKEAEQAEVYQDINFMRDIGPLSRKLNTLNNFINSNE